MAVSPPTRLSTPSLRWAGSLLGFGLGGLFDGILLHQVLQWHHLLSGVRMLPVQVLRFQLLADGLFHLLMYGLTGVALYLLSRARTDYARPGADRVLWGHVLIGFGTWHVVDGLLVHWVLGWHHIRMDVPNPLTWDLVWLALFGLVPLVVGQWLRRRAHGRSAAAPASPGR